MPFVYILRCGDGTLYTGAAKDLARRLAAHAAGKAARYTRGRLPVVLAWSAEAASWGAALVEERRIKGLSRARKLAMIAESGAPPSGRGARSSRGRGPSAGSPRGSRPRGSKAAR
jgi:putative endonuclease